MKHAYIDWESFSSVDIRSGGAYRYVDSPDFEIMLAAYSADGRAVKVFDLVTEAHDDPLFDPHDVNQLPPELRAILTSDDYLIYAHNAQFERLCIKAMWGLDLPISRFRCVMVHGLYCGLPGGLSDVGVALRIPEDKRKLATGKALINLFCKPVKRKDGRTRIMPWDEPEKWDLFKEYCAQDVVAEMEHERLLSDTPVPPSVWREYEMDQRINDMGVRADLDLVDSAIAIAAEEEEELLEEAKQLCGLDNPKSVSQLLAWIQKEMPDEELTDLRKDTVTTLLSSATGSAQRMLEIRQLISKTSTKKYASVKNTICADGRIHGMFQFYGANRTGRYSGRLCQPQNLPRNTMPELDDARKYVLKSDRAALNFLYENVPDTLSQLIRTIFIPSPGHKLIVSDFSAIEARVIAWLAGEQWVLDVFNTHGKIYEATASQMFGVPLELIKKGNPEYELRQRGKVAQLACVSEHELVATSVGLVPIQNVTTDMLVWDGEKFAKHEGVVYNGIREVITYEGLTATPDHIVFIEGFDGPVTLAHAAESGSHLLKSEPSREDIREGSYSDRRTSLYAWVVKRIRTRAMRWMRRDQVALSIEPDGRRNTGMSTMHPTTKTGSGDLIQTPDRCKATMHQSGRSWVSSLRGERHLFRVGERKRRMSLGDGKSWSTDRHTRIGSDRQQRGLRSWESSLCNEKGKHREPRLHFLKRLLTGILALHGAHGAPKATRREDARRDHFRSQTGCPLQAQSMATNRRTARVYDIRNAGDLHRYTVSGVLVHNCGYQGAAGAMERMDTQHKIDPALYPELVEKWRAANPNIVALWDKIGRAALSCVQTGITQRTMRITFEYVTTPNDQCYMTVALPSGRKLYYVRPHLTKNRWDQPSLAYWGMDQTTKKWVVIETYGGKLVENIVQAIARDCLIVAMQRLEAAGYKIVMHIHDEVVIDATPDQTLDDVNAIMGQPIPWAEGLPLRAAGSEMVYYQKD